MKKISTPYMDSMKLTPYMIVFLMAVIFILMVANRVYQTKPSMLLVPAAMAVAGYLAGKSNSEGLADEVYDCGDSLLVRKGREEERVPLANIANISFNAQPSRITLMLDPPGRFGDRILFAPPPQVYWGPNPESDVAQDLLLRVGQARKPARRF